MSYNCLNVQCSKTIDLLLVKTNCFDFVGDGNPLPAFRSLLLSTFIDKYILSIENYGQVSSTIDLSTCLIPRIDFYRHVTSCLQTCRFYLTRLLSFVNGFISGKSPPRIRNESSLKRNLKQRKRRTSASDIPGFLLDLSYFMLHSDKQEVICGVTDSSCSLPTS